MLSNQATTDKIVIPSSFEEIRFKGEIPLRDTELWNRNLERVKWLMSMCLIDRIHNNDYAENLPTKFSYGETKIEFFPHWGFYEVGGINLKLPDSERELRSDLETVNKLATNNLETMSKLEGRLHS